MADDYVTVSGAGGENSMTCLIRGPERSKTGPLARGLCAAVVTFASTAAVAQTESPRNDSAADNSAQREGSGAAIPEIVVTAQKREERLQDVPISVTAITAEMAEARGVTTTEALPVVTPGLVITRSSGFPQVYIRGVGTQNINAGEEPSNAFYVDGVYYASIPASVLSLKNIERVEVLKGPQGTLFGRNSTGGLINVVTRTPSANSLIEASAGYGNHGTFEGQAYLTHNLATAVAADLSVNRRRQARGYGDNRFNGRDLYHSSDYALRSKVQIDLTSRTEVGLTGDYAGLKSDLGLARQVLPGAIGIGGTVYSGNFWDADLDHHPMLKTRQGGGAMRIDHEMNVARLVSITAYRKTNTDFRFDVDGSPFPIAHLTFRNRERQFSQELQLQSSQGSALDWITGVYFLDARASSLPFRIAGIAAGPGGVRDTFATVDTRSIAGFAQVTVPVAKRLNATAGLRYTSDSRDFSGRVETPSAGVIDSAKNDLDSGKLTYRLAADFHFAKDAMVYGSYSRGYKSGAFNIVAIHQEPTRPETLDAFELGTKFEVGRRLRINSAGYYYKYRDIQLVQILQTGATLLNAARGTVYGFESEIVWLPFDALSIQGGINLLHAKYDSFPNAPLSVPNNEPVPPGGLCPPRIVVPFGGNRQGCVIDASGNDMIRAPRATLNIGADYTIRTGFGEVRPSVNVYFNSGYYFEADNRLKQPEFALVNGVISWRPADRRFEVQLWGRNIFNKKYFSNLSSTSADVYTAAAPATYGVSLGLRLD